MNAPEKCPECQSPIVFPAGDGFKFTEYECNALWDPSDGLFAHEAKCDVVILTRQRDALLARVKRLEEAGDKLAAWNTKASSLRRLWDKAKEDRP